MLNLSYSVKVFWGDNVFKKYYDNLKCAIVIYKILFKLFNLVNIFNSKGILNTKSVVHKCYDPFIITTNFYFYALKTILYLYGVSFSFLNLNVSLFTDNRGTFNCIFKVSSLNGKNQGSNNTIPPVTLLSI